MRVILRSAYDIIDSGMVVRLKVGGILAEQEVTSGAWIEAVESAYNEAKCYSIEEWRYLVVDDYQGGGGQRPVGKHLVRLALYDDDHKRYIYEEPVEVEVVA